MISSELRFRKVSQAMAVNGFEERRTGGQLPAPDFAGRRGRFSRSQKLEATGFGGRLDLGAEGGGPCVPGLGS